MFESYLSGFISKELNNSIQKNNSKKKSNY